MTELSDRITNLTLFLRELSSSNRIISAEEVESQASYHLATMDLIKESLPKNKYKVRVYFHSFVDKEIEAINEEEAIDLARNTIDTEGKEKEQFNNNIQSEGGEIINDKD